MYIPCCSHSLRLCLNAVWILLPFLSQILMLSLSVALRLLQKTIWNPIWAATASRPRRICKNTIGITFQTTSIPPFFLFGCLDIQNPSGYAKKCLFFFWQSEQGHRTFPLIKRFFIVVKFLNVLYTIVYWGIQNGCFTVWHCWKTPFWNFFFF